MIDINRLGSVDKIRLSMHRTIYNNPNNVMLLENKLRENLNLFNIEFLPDVRTFRLKLKKGELKKTNNLAIYYTGIISPIMLEFFKQIYPIIENANLDIPKNDLYSILDIKQVYLYYTLLIMVDNVIYIQL
ncbi:MAG: hypothetical protein ACRCXT_18190 [Paraclostridium sp.]